MRMWHKHLRGSVITSLHLPCLAHYLSYPETKDYSSGRANKWQMANGCWLCVQSVKEDLPKYFASLSVDAQCMKAAGKAGAALSWRQFDNEANWRLGCAAQMQPSVQYDFGRVQSRRQQFQPCRLIPGHGQRVVDEQRGIAVRVIAAEVQSESRHKRFRWDEQR